MTQLFRLAMGVLALVVTSALVPTSSQAGECGRLCDVEFWKTATPKDMQAELAKGSDPHARDERGFTPLHFATVNENPAAVSVLLKAGVALEVRAKDGWTPLHFAAVNENPAMVIILLDAGADPKAKTNDSKTAFDLIQENKKLKGTDAYWRLNDLQYE